MKKIVKVLAVSLSMLTAVSCTSSFEEINTDPDAYDKVPYTNMLAYVLTQGGKQFGGDMDLGEWCGYFSAIQYLNDYNGYIPSNNTYGNRWYHCYWGYTQLQDIIDKTEENAAENKNMRNVCVTWQSFLMAMVTDCFGSVPYSEAFKGADGILEAKYDNQSDIYPQILANLKTVADSWASGKGGDELGDGDFLFKGNVEKWQRLCNSLRLRIATRISGVYPGSQAIIEEIYNNPSSYPYIDNCEDNAYFWWQGSGDYYERYFENKRTRDDHGMAEIFVDHLKAMEDPRLLVYAKPAKSDGEYRGFENGAAVAPQSLDDISRIGAKFRDDPAGFTPYFRACESYFMMAEAALKGWNVPMSAADAYEQGVRCNMQDNDIEDAEVDAYLAGKGKWDNSFNRLYHEEWVSLFKQNIEAWNLYRRTGYPTALFTSLAADGVSKQYPGARSAYNNIHNDVPFRFAYPQNEYLYNTSNVNAAATGIEDYVWGKQVWWDTRTNVH